MYGDDEPFHDPVVRCDSCQKLLDRQKLMVIGRCEHCGNRKVKKVQIFNESEMQWAKDNLDPEFMALFEEVDA